MHKILYVVIVFLLGYYLPWRSDEDFHKQEVQKEDRDQGNNEVPCDDSVDQDGREAVDCETQEATQGRPEPLERRRINQILSSKKLIILANNFGF